MSTKIGPDQVTEGNLTVFRNREETTDFQQQALDLAKAISSLDGVRNTDIYLDRSVGVPPSSGGSDEKMVKVWVIFEEEDRDVGFRWCFFFRDSYGEGVKNCDVGVSYSLPRTDGEDHLRYNLVEISGVEASEGLSQALQTLRVHGENLLAGTSLMDRVLG